MYYWYLREQSATVTATGVQVVAVTNVACHLWLRWSTEKTGKHMDAVVRRGMVTREVPRFCVVSYNDVEQDEEGNTITHTFQVTPWPYCETRWYYLWGTMYGEATPSVSPIFKYHREQPPGPIPTSDWQDTWDNLNHPCQYWNAGSQTFTPDHDYNAVAIELVQSQYPKRKGPFVVKLQELAADGCWTANTLRSVNGNSLDLPEWLSEDWHLYEFAAVPLLNGVTYRITAHTTPGWWY
ncbi:unnamed protein product, partial [marine sediment metagenome]